MAPKQINEVEAKSWGKDHDIAVYNWLLENDVEDDAGKLPTGKHLLTDTPALKSWSLSTLNSKMKTIRRRMKKRKGSGNPGNPGFIINLPTMANYDHYSDDATDHESEGDDENKDDHIQAAHSILAISSSDQKLSSPYGQCVACNRLGSMESLTRARATAHLVAYLRQFEISLPVDCMAVMLCKMPLLCYRGFNNWKKTDGSRVLHLPIQAHAGKDEMKTQEDTRENEGMI
ncbi:hypothetical protein BJ741DRAFT_653812 [Chytriomyces cf. hyalinus JEL632]|nr:hypothetical protein BJ741DRAFT_653812 [Chytriomyces cf. hyalinus JEL632]